ncbi:MAG: TolC family protein, partial [bacterium]
FLCVLTIFGGLLSCKTPAGYHREADRVALKILENKQMEAFGKTEPFQIERPADTLRRRLMLDQDLPHTSPASLGSHDLPPIRHWPEKADFQPHFTPDDSLTSFTQQLTNLSLIGALQIGAANSRDYQSQKENVYRSALDLDLQRDDFRPIFSASADNTLSTNLGGLERVTGITDNFRLGVDQALKNGARASLGLGLDVVHLLTQDHASARGLFGDATITVPLLRGAGKDIVTEPLTQAERSVLYALYDFERFKRTFAVQIASNYLAVCRQLNEVQNAEENYRSLIASGRRARRLADAGRLDEIQVDQARQDELRARDRWISAQQAYETRLDDFKILLGLPPDAKIALDQRELDRIAEQLVPRFRIQTSSQETDTTDTVLSADAPIVLEPPTREGGGPYEMEEDTAVRLALDNRLDLRNAIGKVYDAQRKVVVAANQLLPDVTLGGSGSAGAGRTLSQAGLGDSNNIHLDEGSYNALLNVDLGLERTAERNTYRQSLLSLEQSVRSMQQLEDQIKSDIRQQLRTLLESREGVGIQLLSVQLAKRRVDSTNLFLQAGRKEIRDLLDAQESLISAQNALTTAIVNYRIAELEIQRDLDVLQVDHTGLWTEYPVTGEKP